MNPKSQLEIVIHERIAQLRSYAQLPNANNNYIDRENKHIQELATIHESLYQMPYFDIWQQVELNWKALRNADANHAGITIEIKMKPKGILCYIPIELY